MVQAVTNYVMYVPGEAESYAGMSFYVIRATRTHSMGTPYRIRALKKHCYNSVVLLLKTSGDVTSIYECVSKYRGVKV